MPALPGDIAAAQCRVLIDEQRSDPVLARYPGARDTGTEPRPGFFDLASDIAAVNAERFALLSAERRRFGVRVGDVLQLTIGAQVPAVTFVDAEQHANGAFLVSRIAVDLEAETTELELFG